MQTKPCTGQGQHRDTLPVQSPVILSASRSTDIPAFYADWFMARLREGYALWRNPFNQRLTRVSFERVRVIVFWSKNPAPLIPPPPRTRPPGHPLLLPVHPQRLRAGTLRAQRPAPRHTNRHLPPPFRPPRPRARHLAI